MEVIKKYGQIRRDCYIDIRCENCGNTEKKVSAYDDRNMWDNVVPNWKCKKCGKSTNDLKIRKKYIPTRYSQYEVV